MKITSVASPAQIPQNGTPEHVRTAKAIEAFNKGASSYDKPSSPQPEPQVVQNQSRISAEEMGAIIPKPQIDRQTDNEQVETAAAEETNGQEAAEPQQSKPVQDPALSRQFAQLARQEKALRQKAQAQEQAIKAREAALAQREAQLQAQQPDLSKYIPRDRLIQDPISVLDEANISYDDLTQRYVTRQPVDPVIKSTIAQLQDEIKALKLANEQSSKSQTEAQQQQYKAAVAQIRKDAQKLVQSDPDFETIRSTGSIGDVVELIEEHYKETGDVMTVEEAAKEVEEYLVEEAMKLTKIGKIQQRIRTNSNSAGTLQAQQKQNAQQKSQPQMKTLTNATSSNRQLSAKERAILAFKGEKF